MTPPAGPGGASRDVDVAALMASVEPRDARRAVLAAAVRTPTLDCPALAQGPGTSAALKAECLQGTGSFKLRGALSKIAALGARAQSGLVTASAGNHARAIAQAAGVRGVSC